MKRILCVLFILTFFSPCITRAEETVLNGRVLEVNRKFDFAIINLGAEDGAIVGMVFMVYRDKKLLGKVCVEEVFPKMSSCAILPEWERARINVDDGVIAE